MVPQYLPLVAQFEPKRDEVEIVVAVSNYYHRRGGIWQGLTLGTARDMVRRRETGLALTAFLFGGILIVSLYHLGFCALYREEHSALYFGLIVLILVQALIARGRYRRANELAMMDPLTEVYNRNYLYPALERELALARRHGYSVSVSLVDLDRFKAHNDTLGHLKGDRFLRDLARDLRQIVRRSDALARFGGDEFVIVLPHTEHKDALDFVARVKKELAAGCPAGSCVTMSVGVATYPADPLDAEGLLSQADRALYCAKIERDAIRGSREARHGMACAGTAAKGVGRDGD
jgi:diguanylate cyclase (GGDEF)-like protein